MTTNTTIDFCGEPGDSGGYCQALKSHRGRHVFVVGAWEPGDRQREFAPLIGLVGVAGSGKDTVAAYLSEYGYGRLAFADAVRDMALAIDPWVGDERTEQFSLLSDLVSQEGWDSAKKLHDVRQLLQRIGTEAVRDIIGPNTWVEIISRKILEMDWNHWSTRVVLTDCRFPNEAEWIQQNRGLIWRIVRPGAGTISHSSETLLESITPHVTIYNTGTLEDLQNAVVVALARGTNAEFSAYSVDAKDLTAKNPVGWK